MRRIRMRLPALLAAAALLLSLAACDESSSALQLLDNSDTTPVYLNFFSVEDMSGSSVTKYWAERFSETYKKQIYINFDSASYYDSEGLSYRELLETRLESSSPDDLYIIPAEDVLEFEKKGYWMDLSGMDFVDNLSEAALYQSTYNGKVFSVPLSFTGFGFTWNVELLAENGLDVPQNLEEFLNACEVLKSNGILPYGANKGFALSVPAMCAGLSRLYGSADQEAQIAALNSGNAMIGDYLRDGYSFLAMMIEKGYMDPQQALSATPRKEDHDLFFSGGCAFICSGLGDTSAIKERPFEMVMTGIPVLENGAASVYGADKRLCVNPNSKNLNAALAFLEMVGTPEALAENASLDQVMSSAKNSSADGLEMKQSLVSLLQQPGQIPNQDFALHFNTWESIRDVARELCSGASVEEACILLNQKQADDLKAYGVDPAASE